MKYLERLYAITDVETTGLNFREHEIIEIGCALVTQDKLEIIATLEVKVKPLHPELASESALKVNGYNEKEWASAISLKSAMEIYAALTKDAVFAAHNVTFDWGFIDETFHRTDVKNLMDYHRKDTWSIAEEKLRGGGLEKFSLKDLCEHLGVEPEPPPHRAINGALKTLEVWRKLREI